MRSPQDLKNKGKTFFSCSRRSIAGNTSFSYAKVNSSFSSSATPRPNLKPAPETANRSMLLGATPKMATSAAASATPRVPSVTPSRLSALGATPRPVGGGAARASKLATPSSNFQRQGSFCREQQVRLDLIYPLSYIYLKIKIKTGVFSQNTIEVCISCSRGCSGTSRLILPHLTVSLYLCSSGVRGWVIDLHSSQIITVFYLPWPP